MQETKHFKNISILKNKKRKKETSLNQREFYEIRFEFFTLWTGNNKFLVSALVDITLN